jgi:hypothetical protein
MVWEDMPTFSQKFHFTLLRRNLNTSLEYLFLFSSFFENSTSQKSLSLLIPCAVNFRLALRLSVLPFKLKLLLCRQLSAESLKPLRQLVW